MGSLFTHELDAVPNHEWRGMPLLQSLPDESAMVTPLSWHGEPAGLPPVTRVIWDAALDQPTVCTLDDLEELERSGSAFCRKVDPVISAALMDELDRRIRVDA